MSENILYDSQDYFAYIGVFSNRDYRFNSLILDTNVVINLERFYYTPHKMDLKKKQAVIEFLINNRRKDKVIAFGVMEATWDFKKACYDELKRKKIDCAIGELFKWNRKQILKHSESEGNPSALNTTINDSRIDSLIFGEVPHLFRISSYALILKLKLLNRKKQKGRELSLLKEFVRFMIEDIGLIHAIELNMAYDYLLGSSTRSEYVQKILKFNSKNELFTTWNACWDLSFLRFLQQSYVSRWFYIKNPKLVTADDALITLCRYCSLIGHLTTLKSYVPLMAFERKDINPAYISEAENIIREIMKTSEKRLKEYDESIATEKIRNIAMKLEVELAMEVI